MKIHELKCINPFFAMKREGLKLFEIRKDDRDYQVGDTLINYEYNPETNKYSGRSVTTQVTCKITHNDFPDGIPEGYCVMGEKEITRFDICT